MLFAFLRTERIFNFFFLLPLHGILANGFFALGPISNLSRVDFGSSPSDPKTTRACAAPPAHPRSPQAAGEANFTPNAAFLGCFPPLFPAANRIQEGTGQPRSISGAGTGETGPSFPLGRTTCTQPGVSGFHSFFYSLFYSRGCSIRPGCLLQAPFSALIPSALGASPPLRQPPPGH